MTGYPERFAVVVSGVPIPQGSKTVVPGRKGRRAYLRDSNGKTLKPWRKRVRAAAEDATRYIDTVAGPVQVWVRFTFDRPASHYRTGRNAHLLRNGAPAWPTSKNDVDKLQRAIFDALTDAKVWVDDGQVVDVRARKFWAGEHELALEHAGVVVIVEPLTDSAPAATSTPAAGAASLTDQGVLL